MEIPIEQIIDKLLKNRLISRKAVMVIAGLYAIISIVVPDATILSLTQIAMVLAKIVGVVIVVTTGIITQARLDNNHATINQNGEDITEITD